MEHLIEIVFAAALTFVGGVLVHLFAHDLHVRAPGIARRLIGYAVRQLPEADRGRFHEEWLAHLWECEGFFSKARHAIECVMFARSVAKLCRVRPTGVEPVRVLVAADDHEPIEMGISAALGFLHMVRQVKRLGLTAKPDQKIIDQLAEDAVSYAQSGAKVKLLYEILTELHNLGALETAPSEPANKKSKYVRMKVQLIDRFGRKILRTQRNG